MAFLGNAEETETVQQIENVTGHNVLKPPVLCFSPTLCHFCAFHVSGSGVPLPGLRAPEPRAGTGSALSRFLLKLSRDIQMCMDRQVSRDDCRSLLQEQVHLSHEER